MTVVKFEAVVWVFFWGEYSTYSSVLTLYNTIRYDTIRYDTIKEVFPVDMFSFHCCFFMLFFIFRSIEDDIFNTAISLAEQYEISKWEMFMSHLEWLFTDSE